jgi:hypothetical protein
MAWMCSALQARLCIRHRKCILHIRKVLFITQQTPQSIPQKRRCTSVLDISPYSLSSVHPEDAALAATLRSAPYARLPPRRLSSATAQPPARNAHGGTSDALWLEGDHSTHDHGPTPEAHPLPVAARPPPSAPMPPRPPSPFLASTRRVSTGGAREKFCDAGGEPLKMMLFLHVGPTYGTVHFVLASGILFEIV